MKKSVIRNGIIASTILLATVSVWAQASGEASAMPECVGPCTYSQQTIGDTITPVDSSSSYSNQVNPSSSSNVSGVDIGADQRLQQSGNTVDQSGARVGDSKATGGVATASGNRSDLSADTYSSASNGAMTGLGGSAVTGDSKSISDVKNINDVAGGAGGSGYSAQGQDQQQGIANAGNSKNNIKLGQDQESTLVSGQSTNLRTNSTNGIDSAGNSEVKTLVDAKDQSNFEFDNRDQSSHSTDIDARAFYYPSVIPNAPIALAVGNLAVTQSNCGPVMGKNRREVLGTFHGWVMTNNNVHLGYDEDVFPAIDPETNRIGYLVRITLRDGSEQVFGSQVTTTHAIINTGGSRTVSIFGSGSSGSSGQVGANNSSAVQQVVLRQTINMCLLGTYKYVLPIIDSGRQ